MKKKPWCRCDEEDGKHGKKGMGVMETGKSSPHVYTTVLLSW